MHVSKPHLGCKPCGVASFRVQNESDASTKRSAKEHNLNRKGFVSSLSSLAFRKQGHQTIVFEVSVYPRVWINRLINPRSSFEPVFLWGLVLYIQTLNWSHYRFRGILKDAPCRGVVFGRACWILGVFTDCLFKIDIRRTRQPKISLSLLF